MHTNSLPELVLVEDSPDDERMSLRGIANSGIPCRVTVRRDGAEALDHLLSSQAPVPALIVLDYRLPDLNGADIVSQLRQNERTRHVPIVVFTGVDTGGELTDCYRSGANSYVIKPDNFQDYFDRLVLILRYWLTANQTTRTE